MENQFTSKALEANLVETRHEEIDLPEKHRWFVDLSSDHWGIHQRATEFATEYNHKYVNTAYVLDTLHAICLSDLWFYNTIPEAQKALMFLVEVFRDLGERDLDGKLAEVHMKTLFKFIDRLLKDGVAPPGVVESCVGLIEQGIGRSEDVYLRNAGYFKTYLPRAAALDSLHDRVFSLTRDIMERSVRYWKDTADTDAWFTEKSHLFENDYSREIDQIGPAFFEELEERIQDSQNWSELVQNPFFNDIANHFRHFSATFARPTERIHYLIYVMHVPGMLHLKTHLLYDMNRLLREALRGLSRDEMFSFLSEVIDLLAEFKEQHAGTILDCIYTLGKEIVDINDLKLISAFNKQLIQFGFIYPEPPTITSEWQMQVKPDHVKNIRIWLELIETSPQNFNKLLSALVVNLKLGGIFISDTDLFQRDVTKLLNADIAPVYKQIKQLARFFPVYFREIGAEGKLRDVTTAMDEISLREDRLIHFVRKQIHTESNNTHIHLVESVAGYWHTGDLGDLESLLPGDVLVTLSPENRYYREMHRLMDLACGHFKTDHRGLLRIPEAEAAQFVRGVDVGREQERKRFLYFLQLNSLLQEKYSLETADVRRIFSGSGFFPPEEIDTLVESLEQAPPQEALTLVFSMMARLKEVILDPEESTPTENIYYKRHIAIGIPSMYGNYSEPKFEALGLMYRMERIASRLMDAVIAGLRLDYVTAKTLRQVFEILELFKTGLALDGMQNQNFNSNLEMFRFSLHSPSFTLDQYMDLFQFMALNIREIIHEYFVRFYDASLNVVVPQIFDDSKETLVSKSEFFYRDILSSAFMIGQLDSFITHSIHTLRHILDTYSEQYISNMMNYNPDLTVSPFDEETTEMDNQVFLGAKAYYLKKLTRFGYPIPPGFVLTTEVFRHQETVLDHPYMSLELEEMVVRHIARIERATKCKYGSTKRTMLLSVRSGTAISLPGAMTTFLNVGMNEEIAKALAQDPDTAWMSWDAYRRFIQSWGMSLGIPRAEFDALMRQAKEKAGVEKKAEFEPEEMETLARSYKTLLGDHGFTIPDDPFAQLRQSVVTVLNSWNSERARSYRHHLQIANEWGTAVIIQKMVMGNRSRNSGSGVVFTHNPKLSKPGVNLYGDFTLRSQGEDIVAGLVHTLPISESQRRDEHIEAPFSLQSSYPLIYQRLKDLSYQLIFEHGFSNQEIEFTFESDSPEDLYILQAREQIIQSQEKIPVFSIPPGENRRIGRGIGIGVGCLSGRLCMNMEDLQLSRREYPGEKTILARPDTIPDDISKIFLCDGLLTSRGGVTSHAAVTASKLSKVCIVDCKQLIVDDAARECRIQDQILRPGDILSIDGNTGNIYLGRYPIEYI